jgi:hypothetical protein
MKKKNFNFIKIERPRFEETSTQILSDIKSIDSEIMVEDKRTMKYREEIIKDLKNIKKDKSLIPVIPTKITLWMKIKFLFTGKW